jgi:hypothetical protein
MCPPNCGSGTVDRVARVKSAKMRLSFFSMWRVHLHQQRKNFAWQVLWNFTARS